MYVQHQNFDAEVDQLRRDNDPILETFGEARQRWHLWRRRYDLYISDATSIQSGVKGDEVYRQFATIDGGFLAWYFSLFNARGEEFASIERGFRGWGREIFTDTGTYVIRFAPNPDNPVHHAPQNLSVDERALILALSVNVDFDYFSRHSEGSGLGFPILFGPWGSDD